jgi:hypothetical protein
MWQLWQDVDCRPPPYRSIGHRSICPPLEQIARCFRSLRAVFCRRKSPGVNACASFSPWGVDGVGFKSECRSKAELTEKNDEPPCEAEPTENKGCIEEEVHVPYGFALVGTGLPPPLNPWTPNYVSMVPADLAGSAAAGPARSAATASMAAMTERRARNLMSEIAISILRSQSHGCHDGTESTRGSSGGDERHRRTLPMVRPWIVSVSSASQARTRLEGWKA